MLFFLANIYYEKKNQPYLPAKTENTQATRAMNKI